MRWDSDAKTLAADQIVIDSGFYDRGPGAGGPDPLFGASLQIGSFNTWLFGHTAGSPLDAAIFLPNGPTRLLQVTQGASALLTAELSELDNEAGDTFFFATLSNVQVFNTIGSGILADYQLALAQGRSITLGLEPTASLAAVTTGISSTLGPSGYWHDGFGDGRRRDLRRGPCPEWRSRGGRVVGPCARPTASHVLIAIRICGPSKVTKERSEALRLVAAARCHAHSSARSPPRAAHPRSALGRVDEVAVPVAPDAPGNRIGAH